jgi:uncharacterized membrane protein
MFDLNVRVFCILALLCLGIPSEFSDTSQQLYSDVSTEHLISLLHIINYRVTVVVRCKCMVMHAPDGSCSRRTSGR